MFFTPEALAVNRNLRGQWQELWASRDIYNEAARILVNSYQHRMTPEQMAANAVEGIRREYWKEVDAQILQLRDQEVGMEIVTDLLAVQTVLSVGKTVRMYNIAGDIADDVLVSVDGQTPVSWDDTDAASDGDPIPMFTAGFGVNWRKAVGARSAGIDLVLEAQQAKLRKFNKRIVSYMLDGDGKIQVEGRPAQGLRNHRNTVKINLGTGAGGASIDLTTASSEDVMNFFTVGAAGQVARANKVAAYDTLWVSQEILANLSKPFVQNGQVTDRTLLSVVAPFIPARQIRGTFALSGNEFLAYVRRRDVVSPLVGMATATTPKPRFMPQDNFNFQIMAAYGLAVTRDGEGLGGVLYGANLN